MENSKIKNSDMIDLREVFKTLLKKKAFFIKIWIVTFILASAYILPQPRIYSSSIVLAPETGGPSVGGSLMGIASSFGIDIGANVGTDALYPELYPDVMSANRFVVDMLYENVKTSEGVETTYLDYIRNYARQNPYGAPMRWMRSTLSELFQDDNEQNVVGKRLNPNHLSKKENNLVEIARENIYCDVDVKTNVITISAQAQDPLVCSMLASTASQQLQKAITDYRTSKARIDADYYKQLLDSTRVEYEKAVRVYSDYCDLNQNVILQKYISKRDELENDMQTKLTAYNAMVAQHNLAMAKIQERTPAFTVLSEASVPIKPIGPKRMLFVAVILFLSTIGGSLYIFKDEIFS